MEFSKNILKERLQVLEHAYKEYVVSGSVKADSFSAIDNRNKVKDLELALNILQASEKPSDCSLDVVRQSNVFKLYKRVKNDLLNFERARGSGYGIAVDNDTFAKAWQAIRMRAEILESYLENRNPNWTNANYLTHAEALRRNDSYCA